MQLEPLSSLVVEDQAQAEEGKDIGTGAYYGDGGKERFVGYNDKDFTYVCKNNNNNEFIVSPTPPIPPTPPVNIVCTIWSDNTTTDGNVDIFFARSTDGGLTFSDPKNISETTGFSAGPQISSDGNNVYVVWQEAPIIGISDIFFATSTDGGLTFTDAENISENTGRSVFPQISAYGNNVYVVWQDEDTTTGISDIFFATSTDGGLTFSDPENISETTGGSGDPQISSSTSQENQNSEIQMTHPQIQMATPTQQTVSAALQQEDSPIITQGTEEDSSALAKIEKLKKQWLELLP